MSAGRLFRRSSCQAAGGLCGVTEALRQGLGGGERLEAAAASEEFSPSLDTYGGADRSRAGEI